MRLLPLLALAALACAPRPGGRGPPSGAPGWTSALHRDHPLVGRVLEVRTARWSDGAALAAAVARADLVLLGETHDNADHHLLQAWLLGSVASSGRRPAVAFEMLGTHQQPDLDAVLARSPVSPDDVAAAVAWAESGWPAFDLYRPVFAAALAAGLPLVAGGLPRDLARDVVRKGRDALPEGLRERLARDEPFPEAEAAEMRTEMADSHCGELPASLLDPLVLAQRARDAQMAERVEAAGSRGAVLVTGSGHARRDRGVPRHLRRDVPARTVLSVAFLEVSPGDGDPSDYAAAYGASALPFDWVVFTPAAEREDPCAALRDAHRGRRSR
ncbi:MAG TPA: ChaN family lipoprotein [Anaeromyxobacteraceae bacterium]|nr:ChaN family lipoprotein [Anaeromyxobacteraceae bacterium]